MPTATCCFPRAGWRVRLNCWRPTPTSAWSPPGPSAPTRNTIPDRRLGAAGSASATLERGQFIPWETFLEFDLSLGQSEEEIREHYEKTEDVRLTYHGVSAFAGASHWQFTAYKSVLQQFLPFNMDRPMGQVKQLDQRMNAAGLLRLMVPTRWR